MDRVPVYDVWESEKGQGYEQKAYTKLFCRDGVAPHGRVHGYLVSGFDDHLTC